MDDLTPNELKTLHHKLVELEKELETLLTVSEGSAQTVSLDQSIGRLTRMDAMQIQSMAQANRRSHDLRLRQVRAALAAMDEAEYGECKSCEEPIGYARLSVRPEAPFCIACQQQRER